nr:tigger transposable element-derived protein 4 [Helicoverpa armigera]
MASKRKSLCIDEKVLLIRAIETGEKISDVGKRFGFSRSTVSTIWKNKDKILQAEGEGKSSKKLKRPKYEDLDEAILSWFHRQRQNNMPISGPLMKAKAENFAEELGLTSFKASEGWLGKFKQRHHINYERSSTVTYKANKSAWMTSTFFEEEVRKWDTDLKGRKILLLVDNCPAHPFISNLQNIELAFLPPNTTSVLQPMDQSVIKSLKGHYRRKLLMELVESEGKTSVNMLHAVNFLSKAWEEVTPTTIQHSFRHAGLCINFTSDEVETELEFDSDDELPLTEWIQQFNMAENTVNLQTYVEVDDCLLTTASLTDKEILDSVRKTEDQEQGDEEDEIDEPEPPPSIKEALKAAKLLENYFLYHQDVSISQDINKISKKIQQNYWCSKRRQTKITDYTQ